MNKLPLKLFPQWAKGNNLKSDVLIKDLARKIKWEQPKIRIYGKYVDVPRLTTFLGVKNITYSELIHISDEMGKIIQSKSLVMILCSNNLDCVSGLIGFSKTNNCIMLLSENINHDNLNNLIIQYKPDYIYLPINSGLQFSNNFRNIYQTGRYKLLEEENKTFKIINKNI